MTRWRQEKSRVSATPTGSWRRLIAERRSRGVCGVATLQKPIGSGFGAASTAADVIKGVDLSGKTAIVTSGHSGIGLETTRALRSAGAKGVVLARDRDKAAEALHGLDVELEQMDLLDPASIEAFAEKFVATGRPLHILINSAGIGGAPL